jgi:hypothetical protein
MLLPFHPGVHRRYSSLPVFGPLTLECDTSAKFYAGSNGYKHDFELSAQRTAMRAPPFHSFSSRCLMHSHSGPASRGPRRTLKWLLSRTEARTAERDSQSTFSMTCPLKDCPKKPWLYQRRVSSVHRTSQQARSAR